MVRIFRKFKNKPINLKPSDPKSSGSKPIKDSNLSGSKPINDFKHISGSKPDFTTGLNEFLTRSHNLPRESEKQIWRLVGRINNILDTPIPEPDARVRNATIQGLISKDKQIRDCRARLGEHFSAVLDFIANHAFTPEARYWALQMKKFM